MVKRKKVRFYLKNKKGKSILDKILHEEKDDSSEDKLQTLFKNYIKESK